jgi:hypothetical protein
MAIAPTAPSAKHAADLPKMAAAVDTTWNYCNDLGKRVLDRKRRFTTIQAGRILLGAAAAASPLWMEHYGAIR